MTNFVYTIFSIGRPGLPGSKGEVGDWFKGITGKCVIDEKSYMFIDYSR
jgi:hypothetical protein